MSSIHSTHNFSPYTVIGGQGSGINERAVLPCSIVILHRGDGFERADTFERFHRINAQEIISVEINKDRPDIEAIASAYREFKFLVYGSPPKTPGQIINDAIKEAGSRFVLVVWSDSQVLPVSKSYFTEFSENPSLVVLPYIRSTQNAIIPSLATPLEFKTSLKLMVVPPSPQDIKGLFPLDYQGLYDKEQFVATLGYDTNFQTAYWQKMDFGFRAWLWGFNMKASVGLRLQCLSEMPFEQTDPNEDYPRFYARNLLPEYNKDHAHIRGNSWFQFAKIMGKSIFSSKKDFLDHKLFVEETKYRFRQDAKKLVSLWDEE